MRRKTATLLSVVLTVVPLTIVFGVNWLLYEHAGIGRHRDVYSLLASDEAVATSLRAESGNADAPAREVRWSGTAEEPLDLFVVGGSPTRRGVLPGLAETLWTDLHVRVHNVSRPLYPLSCYLDCVRRIEEEGGLDLLVLEWSSMLVSDLQLALREHAGTRASWAAQVLDADVIAAMVAVHDAAGLPVPPELRDAEARNQAFLERARVEVETMREVIAEARRRPRLPRAEPVADGRPFRGHRAAWRRRRDGAADVTDVDRAAVRTNHVALLVLEEIARLCRARGIGLVVYVPPRSVEIRSDPGRLSPLLAEMVSHSLADLRFASARLGIEVLDFDAWADDDRLFYDSVHLRAAGARLFSEELFDRLGAFLRSEGEDPSYARFTAGSEKSADRR